MQQNIQVATNQTHTMPNQHITATKLPDIELDWHFYPPTAQQIEDHPTMHMLTVMGIAVHGVWPTHGNDELNELNDHFVAWTTNAQIIADHAAKQS